MNPILGIGGSPRKGGNTDRLLKSALKGAADAGAKTELLQLRDFSIMPCVGCEKCRKNKTCTQFQDGMQLIYPRILAARGLILASPTHHYNVTAWMKAFIDRLYAFYDFTDTRPRRYTSRLSGRNRRASVIAVCEQVAPDEMGFTIEAMGRPLSALGYAIEDELRVYGIFDRGAVDKRPEVLAEAKELGVKLADALRRNAQSA
jgi:multimeric flavodoxin WrbA